MFKLQIDDRERSVATHIGTELKDINCEIARLEVGDFAVIKSIDERSEIVAIFERKTYEDFAASFKDGRYDNKEKMLNVRSLCGCRVFFIIEGKAFPEADKKFGRISYSSIESSIFHMMVRDNIHALWSKDTVHTAQVLRRFIKSMETLDKKSELKPLVGAHEVHNEDETPTEELLQTRRDKPDISILRELWSCFKGITMDSADAFARQATIAEIVTGVVSSEQIQKFKSATGKNISIRTVNSLTNIPKTIKIKLLSVIPGITRSTATKLHDSFNLRKLITMSEDELAELSTDPGGKAKIAANGDIKIKEARKLGAKRAAGIKKFFNLKLDENGELINVHEESKLKEAAEQPRSKPRRITAADMKLPSKVIRKRRTPAEQKRLERAKAARLEKAKPKTSAPTE